MKVINKYLTPTMVSENNELYELYELSKLFTTVSDRSFFRVNEKDMIHAQVYDTIVHMFKYNSKNLANGINMFKFNLSKI